MKLFRLLNSSACLWIFFLFAGLTSLAQEDISFLKPASLIRKSSGVSDYLPSGRKFSGIPSMAVSPKGRLWANWYAGPSAGEDSNNYVVVSTSGDQGKNWEEVLVIDPDGAGPVRAFDPEMWMDPEGRLWVFWAQSVDHIGTVAGVWAVTTSDPESPDPDWSAPRRLSDGIMMCKPVVLQSGEWVLPASTWRLTNHSARMVVSTDKGGTWQLRGAVDIPEEDREFDEHMVVEKKDGSLWMLVRTKYGIGESVSYDRGKTWEPLVPSKLKHPSARFFIRRLMSGNLLLVKHGPVGLKTGRSHLMAFISKDDGISWSEGLLLDERTGVSYPDGQQTGNGKIFIIYDFDRTGNQHILMTTFAEEDVVPCSDTKMVEVFMRRQIVSRGGPQ